MRRRMLLEQTPPKPSGALYWYGDECIDKTGGLVIHSNPNWQHGSIIRADDHLEISYNSQFMVYSQNKNIDFTRYTTLFAEWYTEQTTEGNFSLTLSDANYSYIGHLMSSPFNIQNYQVTSDDVSGFVNRATSFRLYGQYYSKPSGTLYVRRIWLE